MTTMPQTSSSTYESDMKSLGGVERNLLLCKNVIRKMKGRDMETYTINILK
jgi:hypothetical protein